MGGLCWPKAAEEPMGTAGASFGGLGTREFFGSILKLQFAFIGHSGEKRFYKLKLANMILNEHL